jgi:hypothetical protein
MLVTTGLCFLFSLQWLSFLIRRLALHVSSPQHNNLKGDMHKNEHWHRETRKVTIWLHCLDPGCILSEEYLFKVIHLRMVPHLECMVFVPL